MAPENERVRAVPCLLSAAGFGLMAIFATLAYADGVSVSALLLLRFGLAGAALTAVGAWRGWFRGLTRRQVAVGLAMGAVGYAAQAGLYLAAVSRIPASQVALVFSVYPLLVMVGAVMIGRERASGRRALALLVALAGITLVLGGVPAGGFDLVGTALGAGSALVYTGYILIGDRVTTGTPPMTLAALVCLGGTATWAGVAVMRGGVDVTFTAGGWLWVSMIVLVSTVGAIALFFAGLALAGPTVASLLSIVEPVVTVGAAALVFGDTLTPAQGLGGGLVLGAVLLVQWPVRPPDELPGESPVELEAAVVPAG